MSTKTLQIFKLFSRSFGACKSAVSFALTIKYFTTFQQKKSMLFPAPIYIFFRFRRLITQKCRHLSVTAFSIH